MAIYFGKVNKYLTDRGFGFVKDVFNNSHSADLFFHIRSIKKSDFEFAKKIEAEDISPPVYFWYVTEISEKGEQVSAVLSPNEIHQDYANSLPGFTEKIVCLWKNLGLNFPEWLVQITTDLMGAERVKQLRDERDKLALQIKKENEIKLDQEKERQDIENANIEILKMERLAQKKLLIETQRLQSEVESKEFEQLMLK